jgi:pyruvate/2-oxoglutarate/acetoin dehydrogenase E1 component
MDADPSVIVIGEDVVGGAGADGEDDAWGGVFGVTKGLHRRFPGRVVDTPITESAFVGAAVGAAASGMRPVVELMFVDFLGVCLDQIINQAAKLRYMSSGNVAVPVVIRTMYGAGIRAAAQHSQCLYSLFTHVPGLKIAVPSSPYDAKGLLAQAIRDDDPVVFFEHKAIYDLVGHVPEERYTVPFGQANVLVSGSDITIVALGRMVHVALEAAGRLALEGVKCDVIDPRTTSPLDDTSILESVERTGRLVVVDESHPRCSVASDIVALVAEHALSALEAPPRKVTAPHAPVPFSPTLEDAYVPGAGAVERAVRSALADSAVARR